MSIETISVSLRAWRTDGEEIPPAAFLDRLSITQADSVRKAEGPGVPRVQLASLAIDDFVSEPEPSEAFAAALVAALRDAAQWLATQSPELFESLRAKRINTDVFIGAWIDADQMDLELPVEFMAECARHGLVLKLITND